MAAQPKNLSVYALLAANAVPILGVLFFGWDLSNMLVLYWAENLVVGLFAVLRIAWAQGKVADKVVLSVFFIFHFGVFTAIHGAFVMALVSGLTRTDVWPSPWYLIQVVWYGFLALLVSHGLSFYFNYLGRGECRKTTAQQAMTRPYDRIIVMHISIILISFLVVALQNVVDERGAIMGYLVPLVLIGVKTWVDLSKHREVHGIQE